MAELALEEARLCFALCLKTVGVLLNAIRL